jgi:probable addiction module antidote protein
MYMAKRVKKYEASLIESLKDPNEAVAYLNAHLNEEEGDTEELFLLALRHVAKAYGFSGVAKSAKLGRESLYKALSSDGNPKLETLRSLLKAMGLKLSVEVDDKKRTA